MALLTRSRDRAIWTGSAPEQLDELAAEIRTFLVDAVSKTGGHLGPNLGCGGAHHRPAPGLRLAQGHVLLDTGHQSYVHKLLTGRQDFSDAAARAACRATRPAPSPSTTSSRTRTPRRCWAGPTASPRRNQVRGVSDRQVVAVIGDGALTGGMAWEALNNIAAAKDRPLVIVVNDNERSYSPTIGGLANHLATLRTTQRLRAVPDPGQGMLERTPVVGRPLYETLHGAKKGLKDFIAPQGMFEDLGLKYVGPIDGHDIEAWSPRCAGPSATAAR